MKLRNPHDQPVTLPTLGLHVEARATVEVTGDDAKSLQAQGWTRADPPRKRKKPAAKKPAGRAAKTTDSSTTAGASAPADQGD